MSICNTHGIQARQQQAEGYAYAAVEKLLQHQHLEEDDRINPLTVSIALAFMAVTLLKQWPKGCQRNRLGQRR
jgi:hypothetical protein